MRTLFRCRGLIFHRQRTQTAKGDIFLLPLLKGTWIYTSLESVPELFGATAQPVSTLGRPPSSTRLQFGIVPSVYSCRFRTANLYQSNYSLPTPHADANSFNKLQKIHFILKQHALRFIQYASDSSLFY